MHLLLVSILSILSFSSFSADYEKHIRCYNSKCFYDDSSGQVVMNQKEVEAIPVELSMADLKINSCYLVQANGQKQFLRLMRVNGEHYIFVAETSAINFSLVKESHFLRRYEDKVAFLKNLKSISCVHTPTLGKEKYISKCVDHNVAKTKYFCEKEDLM